jgi:hypothetical protein
MKLITAVTFLLTLALTFRVIAHSATENKQPLKYNYEFKICPDVPLMQFSLTWDGEVGDIIIKILRNALAS